MTGISLEAQAAAAMERAIAAGFVPTTPASVPVVPVVVPEYTGPAVMPVVEAVEPDVVAINITNSDPFEPVANVTVILGANWSHYFIFATAIFGLFWGVV